MTTELVKNHILGLTNAKPHLYKEWAVSTPAIRNFNPNSAHNGLLPILRANTTASASASVSDDTKNKLNNIHKATCEKQKTIVGAYKKTVDDYKASGTHTEDEWKKKLDSATDTASDSVKSRFKDAKSQAEKVIDALDSDADKNAAADYYNDGLTYSVQLIDALVYEIVTVIQSVVDIIRGIVETVKAVGDTIATAAVSIVKQILAL